MEGDLHVGAQESEERSHSSDLDLAIISGVEVIPGLFEVFVEVVISILSLESKMGVKDLLGSGESGNVVEIELSGWLVILVSSLHSVVHNHRVHELVITRSCAIEVIWGLSVVGPVTFESVLKWVVISFSGA